MIVEFIDRFDDFAPLVAVFVAIGLLAFGVTAGVKINPIVGLLLLVVAYVLDCVISTSIVVSYNLELDRFPNNIEAVPYGVIALGWIFGVVIRAVRFAIRAVKRGDAEIGRTAKERASADGRSSV